MPRGDKSKYTDKQEREADHIAEGYEKRGVSEKEADRRAWATVNKDDGGGKKAGGSGRGKQAGHPAAHNGGEKGGEAARSRTAAERSASAKKAAATRKRNAGHHAHSRPRAAAMKSKPLVSGKNAKTFVFLCDGERNALIYHAGRRRVSG